MSELLSELVSEEKSQQAGRPSGSEPTSTGSVSCIIEPLMDFGCSGKAK